MFKAKNTDPAELGQNEQKAYDYALKLLTRREYSRRELYQKLQQRYVKEVAVKTLRHCISANLQSDERYAEMLLRHMNYQGYGPLRFVQSCKKQGIESSIYQPLVETTDWQELAREVLRKKGSRYLSLSPQESKPDYETKEKMLLMLYRRGFPAALVTEVWDDFVKNL